MNKKLTDEQQFYIDKNLEFAEEIYNQADEVLLKSYREQKRNRDDILTEIAKILLSYNITDEIMSLKDNEKTSLYSKLSKIVSAKLQFEFKNETKLTKSTLRNAGKQKYNTNNYLYSLGMDIDWNIKTVDDETLGNIINTKVDDKLWSDRLWDNKNQKAKEIKSEIKDFLDGKTNVNEIEKKVKKKFNENANETKRLVQDNICRVQEGINDVWQHEHNIKWVMYMATLDNLVCHKCGSYDTKVFELDKKPVEIPRHPFCRCFYVSLPNKDWRPSQRLDNVTKEKIDWQTYEQWKKEKALV